MGLRLFLLSILSIGLMVLDHREQALVSFRSYLGVTVSPIQYLVSAPVRLVENISGSLQTHQELLAENSSLRAQQLLLEAQLQKFEALKNENSELRALLQSSPRIQNEKISVAQLLAVSSDPAVSELVVDKGSRNGVYEGQAVLDAYGIMGQIIQISPYTSRVMLISDLRSAVPVQDSRNGVRGIVLGQGGLSHLVLSDIPDTVDIQVGDTLVSSGLGGHFPEGYPVGKVSYVHHDAGDQFTRIEVIPSAQLDRSQDVLLVSDASSQKTKMDYKTATSDKTGSNP